MQAKPEVTLKPVAAKATEPKVHKQLINYKQNIRVIIIKIQLRNKINNPCKIT